MNRRKILAGLGTTLLLPQLSRANLFASRPTFFDVREFGGVGDGRTNNTVAIQKSIDACSAVGGTVLIADGHYLTGTLFLKSNVTLRIEAGAALLGSGQIRDYPSGTGRNMYAHEPEMDRCLIFARDAKGIGIEGQGVIDGQGAFFPNEGDARKYRPMLIRLIGCENVLIKDVTLQNPAAWTCAFLYSNNIRVDGIHISSLVRGNGDGLDFDGCQNVQVSNCDLNNSDDSICLQCSDPDKPVRNVVISNCIMTSRWAAIRIGLLSRGDFKDVTVSNCIFHDITGEAIKIQLAEGGKMENFLFSNIVMRNVPRPVFLTFNSFPFRVDSPGEPPPMQSLRKITFSDIRIEADQTSSDSKNSFFAILGLPGYPIEDVVLNNISFTAPGGGTKQDATRGPIPELAGLRPERQPLGESLPAYGLYARHVRNLEVRGLTLQTLQRDQRPGIVCEDVERCVLSEVAVLIDAESEAAIVFKDIQEGLVQSSRATGHGAALLRVEGAKTSSIGLVSNDLRGSRHAFSRDSEVAATSIVEVGSLE